MGTEAHTKRDIKNILSVLFAGIVCAALFSGALLYYYGPTGRYAAANVLLDPNVLEHIDAKDQQRKRGRNVRFLFDKIEFSYFLPEQSQMQKTKVSLANYQRFYALVEQDLSLEDGLEDLFHRSRPVELSLYMRTIEGTASQEFQIVQFNGDNHYRVQLQEGEGKNQWAYFYHPDIYLEAMKIFAQTEQR